MRTDQPIRILVNGPQDEAGKRELARRVAELHADFVLAAIGEMDCPAEQKQALLRAIIDAVKARGNPGGGPGDTS